MCFPRRGTTTIGIVSTRPDGDRSAPIPRGGGADLPRRVTAVAYDDRGRLRTRCAAEARSRAAAGHAARRRAAARRPRSSARRAARPPCRSAACAARAVCARSSAMRRRTSGPRRRRAARLSKRRARRRSRIRTGYEECVSHATTMRRFTAPRQTNALDGNDGSSSHRRASRPPRSGRGPRRVSAEARRESSQGNPQ